MSLSLHQIQDNCRNFYNYSFTNLIPETDETVTGISNWNLPLKLTKSYTDWSLGYKNYELLQKIVLKTLEGIKQQLATQVAECPLFFYMDATSSLPTAITYQAVATRILNSRTFALSEAIRQKAQEILDLYENHHFGISPAALSDRPLETVKRHLLLEIDADLKQRYSSSLSLSLQNLQAALHHQSNLPPENPFDTDAMKKYLQLKLLKVQATFS